MAKGRPRKPGERTPCGALKRSGEGLTPTAIKRIMTDLERGAHDEQRFKSQVGTLLFEKKLDQREAAAAFKFAEIYGRFERLHRQRRSAVSPSYMIGRGGAPALADERMTGEQIGARENREKNTEAAFFALQDEIASDSRDARDALERLCVEDHPVPGWLDEVKRILRRLALMWHIDDTAAEGKSPPKPNLISYDPLDGNLDPNCEIVSRAIEIVCPLPDEESMCRWMIVYVISQCRIANDEIGPAFLAAEQELGSAIQKVEDAEKALSGLRRIYKRLAFQDREDFDGAATKDIDALSKIRKRLRTLADGYGLARSALPRQRRPKDQGKRAAASYAYCCLVAYSERSPTLTSDGPFFELASIIYEGATGEPLVSLDYQCCENFRERGIAYRIGTSASRSHYHADLRHRLREGQKDWLREFTETRPIFAVQRS
jgi:hypothetical protein